MMMMLRRQLRVKAKIASMMNTLSGYDTTQSKSRLDMWAAGHLQEGPASLLKVGDRLAVNLAGGLFSQILYEEDLRQDW
ncbi:unnamed protein product [Sphagnum troendelagicum]|uniref:Uncharacterized protein n=1 Tax=Sphagnum troendelagicum TaxID=128251 RepID=A0ABP0UBV3_9BRYO